MGWIACWLMIVLGWIQGGTPPATPAGQAETIACTICGASGKAKQACLRCEGEETVACPRCFSRIWLDEEVRNAAQLTALFPDNSNLKQAVGHLMAYLKAIEWTRQLAAPEPKASPLRIDCPADCNEGNSRLGKGKCKYCAGKAKFDCPDCAA
ncbi:MAG: hypothetical protein ABIP42_13865, partial [Planctomycetota bacterium]